MGVSIMAKNTIQFQKGLGLHGFLEKCGTEERCHKALYQLRWPAGYICPECGNTTGCELKSRPIYQCNKFHHQTALTTGTIFDRTKLPLKQWFLAIYLPAMIERLIFAALRTPPMPYRFLRMAEVYG